MKTYKNLNSFGINVYPNPSKERQILELSVIQPFEGSIRLLDMSGKILKYIYDGYIAEGTSRFEIDIQDLPCGVYFYTIMAENKDTYRYKIIKQ